jgi:hypothetical protein
MSDDLAKRLRDNVADILDWNGKVMTAWDTVRAMIAKGDKGSLPRDIMESYLHGYAEDMKEAADRIEKLESIANEAYTERNRLVALLASLFPSGVKKTDIPGWDAAWHGCVYIDLPHGQASWHFHDDEAHLFAHLPPYKGEWDGHTTEEKYERIARQALEEKDE